MTARGRIMALSRREIGKDPLQQSLEPRTHPPSS